MCIRDRDGDKEYLFASDNELGIVLYIGGAISSETDNFSEPSSLVIYPNPSLEDIEIQLATESISEKLVRLFSSEGELLKEMQTNLSTVQIETSSLPKGMYWIQVIEGDEISTSAKFVKI